jgi:ureidoglycolate hydrolase
MSNIREVNLEVYSLKTETFKKFGKILNQPLNVRPAFANEFMAYWNVAEFETSKPMSIIYMNLSTRPFILDHLERHIKTQEILIPTKGFSILPVAPSDESNDPEAPPPINKTEAFLLSPDKAVIMNQGVWHWAPFPISDSSSFIVIVKSETIEKDLFIKNLEESFNVRFKLSFEKFPRG